MFTTRLSKLRNFKSRISFFEIRSRLANIQITPRRILVWVVSFLIIIYVFFVLIGSFIVYGKGKENAPAIFWARIVPYPAAFVGPDVISLTSLNEQFGFIKNYSSKTGQAASKKSEVLDSLVENALIQRELKKHRVRIGGEEVNAIFDKITQEQGGKDKVLKVLSGLYKMDEKDFKKLIKRKLQEEKLKTEVIVNIKARHILIKDEGKAKEILERAKKGEDFVALAKEFSQDANTKDKGGELDWFSRGTLAAEFENVAFSLKKGEIAPELVKTEFGFHIIKLEDKRGTIDQKFDDWLNEAKKKTKIVRLVK